MLEIIALFGLLIFGVYWIALALWVYRDARLFDGFSLAFWVYPLQRISNPGKS